MDLRGDGRDNLSRMSQLLRKTVLVVRMAVALTIASLAFTAAGATSATSKEKQCSWGASSVTAWVDVDGTVHQGEPSTTGCNP
jgi:hypothetical protein